MAYAAKEILCYCRSDKIGEHNIVGCGILLLDAYGESLLQVSQRLLAHAHAGVGATASTDAEGLGEGLQGDD